MSDSYDAFLSWFLLDNNVLRKRRRMKERIRELNLDRFRGEFMTTCVPWQNHPEKFKEYYRMSIETFNYIFREIRQLGEFYC